MKINTILKAGLSLLIFFAAGNLNAQDVRVLTMEECIDIALKNNLDLQRSRNSALIASANKKQAILNYLPTLNASINYDWFTGTFFDTNAARQVSETTNSSNPRLNANLNIFNGFRNHSNRKRAENEFSASNYAVEASKQNVRTNVIALYLSTVANRENIKISEGRLDLLSKQLEREEKREKAGVGNIEQVYNLKSQVANEKLNLVTAKNNYQRDKLSLIQALMLKDAQNIEIANLEITDEDTGVEIDDYQNVINKAVTYSPDIKRADYSLLASKNAIKVAQADRYPSISFSGTIGSNYSSNGARNPSTGDIDPDATFFDQLDFNQFEYANIRLQIPIFNRGQTNNAIQVAKINMINAELDLKQAEVDLTNAVQQAYLDLVAAKSTYEAATENLIALEQSFKFMEARYNSGNSDFYAYLESLNNKNRGEIELANAKYSIALRKKILSVLQGE